MKVKIINNSNNMEQLINNVIKWAEDKNLTTAYYGPQVLKIFEEIGETARAILKKDQEQIKDGLGDVMVTIIIYSKQINVKLQLENYEWVSWGTGYEYEREYFETMIQNLSVRECNEAMCVLWSLCEFLGFTPEECLQAAWDEIKNRTGVTKDGVFIKDEVKEEVK